MSYVLFNLISKRKVKSYSDHEGARRGMRCMNRNAGWNRITRANTGSVEMEWCLPEESASGDVRITQCGYGPYAIMPEKEFDNRKSEIKSRIQRVKQPEHRLETSAVVEVEMVPPIVQPPEEVKKETPKKEPTPKAKRKETPKKEPVEASSGKKRVLKRGPAPKLIKENVVEAAKRVERSNKRLYHGLR